MSPTTAELDARLDLLEAAFFGDDEPEESCDCDFCAPIYYETAEGGGDSASPDFAKVVLDGAEEAITRLTEIAEHGDDKEALEASGLLLQYGLALVDRGRV